MTLSSEREAEVLKPLASVEVTEKEDATFETEISEEDVPGEWKLRGVVLTRSPVRLGRVVHPQRRPQRSERPALCAAV